MCWDKRPEEDLVRRARGGERDAFDELLRRDYRSAKAYALKLTENDADAEDLVEDTYLKICVSIDRFEGDSKFATWRSTIERNCFLDACRKNKNRDEKETPLDRSKEDDEPAATQLADPSPGPEAAAVASDGKARFRRKARECLDKLPPAYRLLLLIVDQDGFRYEELLCLFDTLLAAEAAAYAMSFPAREGLSFEDFKKLCGQVRENRNAFDLKMFHARKRFRELFLSLGDRP